MAYFLISITLLFAGLFGGLMISRKPRRVWVPVCIAVALAIALLGFGLHWEKYDAYFVYLWPDAVYFQTAKVMWLGFFLFGVAFGLYRQQAAATSAPGARRSGTSSDGTSGPCGCSAGFASPT